MKVAIIKYNAGNIYSVYCACRRLGHDAVITDDPVVIRQADRVIFPGVGEARAAMQHLNQTGLADVIRGLRQPVLGICIGMQLLCRHSEEGDVDCLGIFDVPVVRFRPSSKEFKVPQMGWNTIEKFEKTAENGKPVDDAEIVKIIQKLVKQRKESAEIYSQQNRPELADNELAEVAVMERYLPKQLSEAEIEEALKGIIAQVGATSMADMGKVMGTATKALAGQADGKVISALVRKLLA